MLNLFLCSLFICHCICAFQLKLKHILFGPEIFCVRGIRHYPEGHIHSLVGKQVHIEREKNNMYDPNVIKVVNQENKCCGYISRSHAALLSPSLDSILSLSELSATPIEVECDLLRCDSYECDLQVRDFSLSLLLFNDTQPLKQTYFILQVTICCPTNSRLPRLFHTWQTVSDIKSYELMKETLFSQKHYRLHDEQYDYFGNFELGNGNGL